MSHSLAIPLSKEIYCHEWRKIRTYIGGGGVGGMDSEFIPINLDPRKIIRFLNFDWSVCVKGCPRCTSLEIQKSDTYENYGKRFGCLTTPI